MELNGKRALVTGASRGLGAITAQRLAAAGADVAVTYAQDSEGARTTAKAVESEGRRTLSLQADLTTSQSAAELIAAIAQRWGGLDLLVNNAGAAPNRSWESVTTDEWDETLALNLSGPFYLLRSSLPLLKASTEAAVVNVGSVVSFNGGSFGPAYAASKAGLLGLTRSAARDWGPHGIRVNCVAPGPLDSPLAQAIPAAALQAMAAQTPLRRLGTFAEVADVITWLLSPQARYMTGQTIVVDGGRVMN